MPNELQASLRSWLEHNIPTFLTNLPQDENGSSTPWEMPLIEDYVLVVAIKDVADNGGGVFSIYNEDIPRYRMRGLLAEALD
jgi:hypothetical protein